MTLPLALEGILLVLLFPPLFRPVFGLEEIRDHLTEFFRYLLWGLVTALFVVVLSKTYHSATLGLILAAVLSLLSLEIIARALIKYGTAILPQKGDLPAKIRQKITEKALYGVFTPRFEPHPFLHFTLPRNSLEGGNAEMGFTDITLRDIPKPPGTIRVACIGNSTTHPYPPLLEEFLNKACPRMKFQALNFGMGWWSSLHSTVNFILNVIDFEPNYVVLHENCNDHNYRGYAGLRGDAVHAYRNLTIPVTQDIYWSRLSVLYRILAMLAQRRFPKIVSRHYSMERSILKAGKDYSAYDPRELYIFERNLETVYAVSKHRGINLCLMTLPFSNVFKYGEEHDRVYRPHIATVNDMMREKAARYRLLLADADRLMTGEEDLFWDPVHVIPKGYMIKAYLIGSAILKDLGLPMQIDGEWKDIEHWVTTKAARLEAETAEANRRASFRT
jgi:hypothetical protein